MPYHGLLASQASRLEALKSRHAALSKHIDQLMLHPSSEDEEVKEMKVRKLSLKDEIQELEDGLKDAVRA